MKRILDTYRLSPAGGGLVLLLVAAILVLIVGPRHDQAPALIVIVVVVVMFAVQAGGSRASFTRSLDERRGEFGPPRPRLGNPGQDAEEADQDEAWERERREE
ncbi:MAG TPA: hypothetical protein VH061_07695 [Solirubrobacteraceae bacterium]|nr:hypothetical protein [Solirubrobacteraceae bacterium]